MRQQTTNEARTKRTKALSRLERLDEPEHAAWRLFAADALIKAGMKPEAILTILAPSPQAAGAFEKYNSAELRISAGNGRPSGEWAREGEAAGGQPRVLGVC